jgi:hypothetical protein
VILGMSTSTFTAVHVVVSLIGIVSGAVVVLGMLGSSRLQAWTALFLASTVATSVTGFLFPRDHLLPSHVVGVNSLVLLAVAIFALYFRQLARPWRRIYVVGAVASFYLNAFVAVVQSFQKLAPLHRLAPTQSKPAFLITQLVVMVIFVVLGIAAVAAFHPQTSGLTPGAEGILR